MMNIAYPYLSFSEVSKNRIEMYSDESFEGYLSDKQSSTIVISITLVFKCIRDYERERTTLP